MPIEVRDLRLSFIWVETLFDLLDEPPRADAPFAFLGDRDAYAQRFEQALRGSDAEFAPPWGGRGKPFFWTHYLEGRVPASIDGARAWKALVPLRARIPAAIRADRIVEPLTAEAFLHPHDTAFVLTVRYRAPLTLEPAVEEAFEARRTARFTMSPAGGPALDPVPLDVLADRVLALLRGMAFGPSALPGARSATPFSVATVVSGSGVDPAAPVTEGSDVHRALEALTTWRPTWKDDVLPPLADARVPTRTAPASHVLYGRARGRAVWFPALFAAKRRDLHSLTCYHRNLNFAALQVESLARLLSGVARRIQAGAPLPQRLRLCAKRAAVLLGLLYAGHDDTYRSWSPRRHIDQNGLAGDVNAVRDYFDLDALA